MRTTALAAAFLSAALTFGPPAAAQETAPWPTPSTPEVLPRPDFRFKGEVGRTILDSDPAQFPQTVRRRRGRRTSC